ncbi:hypothetical protein F4680DRAFT_77579 [Xylaria scruposa]|nr:hypothetical protein F4680DRAFT_77579 [Xylaria scruposa]
MPEGEANVTEASRSRADEDDHEIPNARLKSIDDGAGRKQRNGNGNTVQEPFAVRKARLLQELEDLKKREEELNNEDELRELERELEAVRKRIRDREMKVAHETTHVTSLGEQLRSLLLATTDVGLNSVVPQTTAVGRTETRQRNSVTATDSKAQASHLTRNTLGTSVHEFGELEYYKEVDSDKSQSFQDMDIPELRRLAANEQDSSQVEGIKKATSIIHIHYSIFSKTGAIEDLERAIQLANEQMPVDDGSPSYATQLKNLVVMLVKKYRCTNSMSDLQEAIFRAQEMVAATPLAHSSRSARVKDFITMMLMKFSRTGSQDALDEATITAREVGASISVDSSGGRGLVIKVGIPE